MTRIRPILCHGAQMSRKNPKGGIHIRQHKFGNMMFLGSIHNPAPPVSDKFNNLNDLDKLINALDIGLHNYP
ncbi:hypothetical protein D3C81_2111580 [compost metagenome]